MSMVFPGITHCEYCGERIDIDTGRRCNCLDGERIIQENKPKLKLIDILNKIANGELKEGTKVVWKVKECWGDIEYTYKDGDLEREVCGETIYVYEEMFSRHLKDEVELIEPDHFPDVGKMAEHIREDTKMIEPTDNIKIEELDIRNVDNDTIWDVAEKIQHKLNEVIRVLNKRS